MYLVKFLLIGALWSIIFGEFSRFPFGNSGGSIYISDILIFLSLSCSFIWIVSKGLKIFIPRNFNLILVFYLIALLSLVFSLKDLAILEMAQGSLYLIRFILYSSVLFLVFNLSLNKILLKDELLKHLMFSGGLFLLLGFLQLLILPDFESPIFNLTDYGYDPHKFRLASTFLDPNFAGSFLILILVVCLIYLKNWWRVFICCLLSLGVVLTYSRSAYLMFLVTLTSWYFFSWNKFNLTQKILSVCLPIFLIALTFVIFPRFQERLIGGVTIDKSSEERFESWNKGLQIFKSSPIFGVGFNNLRVAFEKQNLFENYSSDGGHGGGGVDSSFLLVLASTGLLGFLTYFAFWISTLTYLLRLKSKIIFCLILGLLVNSQFINSLFFVPIMFWFFALLGTAYSEEA
ncbi:MAG: O-antigen ligase family protein [Candidatus Daviesbacteria bacterium]|nr:O-antigen ligase family protein [Candidatus Daviesbacteria bacterium]